MINPIGIVKAVGSVLKVVLNPIVGAANKAPDGTLTGLGGVIAGAGVAASALSGQIVTSTNIVDIINAIANVVTAIGGILIAIGAQRAKQRDV